jgi:hypothetical protein
LSSNLIGSKWLQKIALWLLKVALWFGINCNEMNQSQSSNSFMYIIKRDKATFGHCDFFGHDW